MNTEDIESLQDCVMESSKDISEKTKLVKILEDMRKLLNDLPGDNRLKQVRDIESLQQTDHAEEYDIFIRKKEGSNSNAS